MDKIQLQTPSLRELNKIWSSIDCRLDSIGQDSKVILKKIGVKDHFPITHVNNNKRSEKGIEKYFSQLDRHTLDKLYKVFEMDFVLFNYTIDAFYSFVENKTNS